MKHLTGLLVCCCLLTNFVAEARPKIGLVLSGGGAKGTAHVGVLKVLEKNRIPIDYIAGTSIGAFVGGLYALGYSADEIEHIMLTTDWAKGYSDIVPRQDLNYRDKQERDRYNIPLNMGFSDGKLRMPNGVLRGQTMSELIRNSTNLVPEYTSFNQLPIPYRAVATNLATGKAVVLKSGSIIQAMQASASVPGALVPDDRNNQLLVDGGIADNMPVDVAKSMGADIVIAVDIGSSLMDNEQLDSTIAVLTQLSTILTNASTQKQINRLSAKDILIRPDVGDMSTTDFDEMSKALALGDKAAKAKLSQLRALSLSNSEYNAYLGQKTRKRITWQKELSIPTTKIILNNQSKVSDSLIKKTLNLKEGDVITKEALNAAVERVYALNKFERVNTEFFDTQGGRELIVVTKAKSWGPNYFQLGLNWEDDFKQDSAVTVNFSYTLTDLTENGGEWRNEASLGTEKLFATEFYQPLDINQNYYGVGRYQYKISSLHQYIHNQRFLTFDETNHQLDLGVGYNYTNNGRAEMGFTGQMGDIDNEILIKNEIDYSSFGGYIKLGYDSLDSISFPTEGNRFNFDIYLRHEDFTLPSHVFPDNFLIDDTQNPSSQSLQIKADWKGALSLGNHAFVGKMSLATVDKSGQYSIHTSKLGGFLNLSGFSKNALMGPHKLFGALIYQYDLGRDALGISDFPLYLGTSIEAGNVWQLREQVSFNDLIYASSLYIGTDTRLGPAALGFGFTDKGDQSFYLFIGKNF